MLKPNPHHRGDPLFLPDVLHAFNLTVRELPAWRDRGQGDFGQIWGVIAHHTGSNNTSPDYVAHNPGLDYGLSSQLHLARDGVVTILGAGIAWHAGVGSYPGLPTNDANRVTIGVEAQSDGVSPWPAVQLDAYWRVCASICWYLGVPASHVIGHKEWAGAAQGKWDPGGIDMNDFRTHVQHFIDHPPFTNNTVQEGFLMSLSDNEQHEVLDQVREIRTQLRGPGDKGWPQLGTNEQGQCLTLVDAVAALSQRLTVVEKKLEDAHTTGEA